MGDALDNTKPDLDTLGTDLETLMQRFPSANAAQLKSDMEALHKKLADVEHRDHQVSSSQILWGNVVLCLIKTQIILNKIELKKHHMGCASVTK